MKTTTARAVWLDYLRSFVTLLVVAHHAALAYPIFAHFTVSHYIWSTAPIVDQSRWIGLDTFIGFNDLFFMPLMFFISGLFVYPGLTKKGAGPYLADRLIRLGVPFLVAEFVLIPLAYLPSFYLATGSTDLGAFITDYVLNQQWPVGPPWFIWLLLAFDGIAVLLVKMQPAIFPTIGNWFTHLSQCPGRFSTTLYGLVALSLIPLSLWVGQYTWVGHWGPFDFQLNRLLFYLLFFLVGTSLSATDWQHYLFKQKKLLGKSWLFWLGLSGAAYGLFVLISRAGAVWVTWGTLTVTEGFFLYDLAFVGSCLASISACLAFFRQKMIRPMAGWNSLSVNAYGIYIVHYGFVTWLQFGLLGVDLPAIVKFGLVFSGALAMSWLCSSLARRSTYIARFI